jgi:hypothetical protein
LNKLKIVEKELEETMFFLELLAEFNTNQKQVIQENWREANELLSIVVSSIVTIRKKDQKL